MAHKLNIQEEKGTISTLQSAATSSYEHEYNVELREKNEKLKKMISERISTENTSAKKKKQYREVSVDRDEPAKNVQQIPLPLKRTSLEVTKELIPPVVKPRTIIHIDSKDDDLIENSHEYVTKITSETVDNPEQIQVIEETPVSEQKLPKSILKNSDTNSNLKKIKFQEVSAVITSSESGSDTDDSSDNYEEDTWNLVDQHRNALNRKDISSSSPPPLPTSSPPSLAMAEQSNNYSFA